MFVLSISGGFALMTTAKEANDYKLENWKVARAVAKIMTLLVRGM